MYHYALVTLLGVRGALGLHLQDVQTSSTKKQRSEMLGNLICEPKLLFPLLVALVLAIGHPSLIPYLS
jgi:hypothetical protein